MMMRCVMPDFRTLWCQRPVYVVLALGLSLLNGCTTPKAGSDGPGIIETHATIETLRPVAHQSPLPHQTEIRVTSWYSDGSRQTRTGLWGWDFNADGRFDMVEVLGRDGKRAAIVYDFNFDGRVDMTENADGSRKLAGGQPMPVPPDAPNQRLSPKATSAWPTSIRDSEVAPPVLPSDDGTQLPLN